MIELELKVGELIKGDAFVAPPTKLDAGKFFPQSPVQLTIEKSTVVETGRSFASRSGGHVKHTNIPTFSSNVARGQGPKAGRNFQWLGFYPGMISHVPLSTDVLTGPMSGCWVVAFKLADVVHVGHIGTDVREGSENSKAAREAWKLFFALHKADVIGGFQPYKMEMGLPPKQQGDGIFTAFGAVAKDGPKFYSVITYRQSEGAGKVYRIARVTECASSLPDFG